MNSTSDRYLSDFAECKEEGQCCFKKMGFFPPFLTTKDKKYSICYIACTRIIYSSKKNKKETYEVIFVDTRPTILKSHEIFNIKQINSTLHKVLNDNFQEESPAHQNSRSQMFNILYAHRWHQ